MSSTILPRPNLVHIVGETVLETVRDFLVVSEEEISLASKRADEGD